MNKYIQLFNKESFKVPLYAILLGMIIGAIMMLIGGYNPFIAYIALFQGVFGNIYNVGETIRQITPLIFTGLAVAFAFRTGLFNIGAEGQFLTGALAAIYVGVNWNLPPVLHAIIAVLVGGIVGGLWAFIPGYLKAKRGVHEVITTIMLNWVALMLTNYLIRNYLKSASERTELIQPTASLKSEWLANLFDNARIHYGFIIGLIMAYLVYIILWKTILGYELRAVGFNPLAAEYSGMNVSKNIIISMVFSGFLAGMGGAAEYLGVYGYMPISGGLPGFGFDGIAVALIGGNTPLGVILGAILFGGLNFGARNMQMAADVPFEVIRIVISMIIFFVAASGMVKVIFSKINLRRSK